MWPCPYFLKQNKFLNDVLYNIEDKNLKWELKVLEYKNTCCTHSKDSNCTIAHKVALFPFT